MFRLVYCFESSSFSDPWPRETCLSILSKLSLLKLLQLLKFRWVYNVTVGLCIEILLELFWQQGKITCHCWGVLEKLRSDFRLHKILPRLYARVLFDVAMLTLFQYCSTLFASLMIRKLSRYLNKIQPFIFVMTGWVLSDA